MRLFSFIALAAPALAAPIVDDITAETIIVPRQVKGGGGSARIQLLFARGTTEPGTMGMTVGPALSSALSRKFPGTKADGVSYPADFGGAFSGGTNPKGAAGAIKMAEMAKKALAQNMAVVLSGYSQGAEQVHGALLNLGPQGKDITAAVTFGDPLKKFPQWGSLPLTRTKVFCTSGDGVCGGAFAISAAHMAYTSNGDIAKAVDFISEQLKAPQQGSAPAAPKGSPKGSPKGAPQGAPEGTPEGAPEGAPQGSEE